MVNLMRGLQLGLTAATGQGPTSGDFRAQDLVGELQGMDNPLESVQFQDLAQLRPQKASAFDKAIKVKGQAGIARKKAFIQDMQSYAILAENGYIDKAIRGLDNRLDTLSKIDPDADTTDTTEMRDLLVEGSPESIEKFLDRSAVMETIAMNEGIISEGQILQMDKDKDAYRMTATGPKKIDFKRNILPPVPDQKQINVYRKSISDVTKSLKLVDASYKKILAAGNKGTAAGDMSLIFSFMKILDPGSTVREGEFANAQNAAGLPDKAVNFYNQTLKGTRLGPEQRADFISNAKDLLDAQQLNADESIEGILSRADGDGFKRVRVFGEGPLASFNRRAKSRLRKVESSENSGLTSNVDPTKAKSVIDLTKPVKDMTLEETNAALAEMEATGG
jgi:hypothetical protein